MSKKITRTCGKCGKNKEIIGHYSICLKNQTCTIIEKFIHLTNHEKDNFNKLYEKGLDEIAIRWFNKAFDYLDDNKDKQENVQIILQHMLLILKLFEENSIEIEYNDTECHTCGEEMTTCQEKRLKISNDIKEKIMSIVNFDAASLKILDQVCLNLTHVGIEMFNRSFEYLNEKAKHANIVFPLILELFKEFIDNARMMSLLSECDASIGL